MKQKKIFLMVYALLAVFILNGLTACDFPGKDGTRLITFDEYLTLEETDAYVATLGDCEVKEIYLGIPDTDGRIIIGKAGEGTVSERVTENMESMLAETTDEMTRQQLLEYQNHAKVFAIKIQAVSGTAAGAGKPVSESAILVPDKPDDSN